MDDNGPPGQADMYRRLFRLIMAIIALACGLGGFALYASGAGRSWFSPQQPPPAVVPTTPPARPVDTAGPAKPGTSTPRVPGSAAVPGH